MDADREQHNLVRHVEQAWEIELAESAKSEAEEKARERGSQMLHYVRALEEHYGGRRPIDLTSDHLGVHAEYLERRYRRIARYLVRMTRPGTMALLLNRPCLRENVQAGVYFRAACGAREQIRVEMHETILYWQRVQKERRLPPRLLSSMGRYNKRPVYHPWKSITAAALDCLAPIEQQLRA